MKRYGKYLFLALILCLLLAPVMARTAEAAPAPAATQSTVASGTCGDNLTWTLDDQGTLTISGTGSMSYWSSASNVPWYSNREQIKSVVMESGVTSIGDDAFSGCSSLTDVTIPASVAIIHGFAFSNCNSLREVYVSDLSAWCGIEFIYPRSNPLVYAQSLYVNGECITDLVIPNGVTSICDYAFYCYRNLTSVTIPDSVTSIGNYAFEGCNMTNMTIGSGVTSIGYKAFAGNRFTSVTIPNSVTSIGLGAFEGCRNLTGVYISDLSAWCEIDFIDYSAGDDGPNDPDDPNYGTSNPLYYAHNLYLNGELITELTIPASVTHVKARAFWGCSLTSVIFEGQAPEIGQNCFYQVTATAYYPVGDITWTADAFQNYGGTLTWVACGSIVASGICGDNLSWVLNSAGTLAISGTGAMYNWTTGNTPWYADRAEILTLQIGDDITGIGNSAFEGCSRITSVVIPYDVNSIGSDAFLNCSGLTSVTLGSGVTDIGYCAFSRCSALTSVTIPASVTSLGRGAFSGCSGLTRVEFWGPAPEIGQNCFYQVTATVFYPAANSSWTTTKRINYGGTLTWVAWVRTTSSGTCGTNVSWFLDSMGTLAICGTGTTYDWTSGNAPWCIKRWMIQALSIGNGVTGIGNSAFEGCSRLTGVIIPNSVTRIGDNAFLNCSRLTSVTLGSGVADIGYCAFSRCSALTSVTIPASVTSLGRGAFSGCSGMTRVEFKGNAPEIGQNCFYQVTSPAWYPAGDSTWTASKCLPYGGNLTWKPYSISFKNSWQQFSGKWYHFDANGYAQTGWQKINNVWYWFKDSGAMATGWQKIGNVWYYFKDSGAMVTGWQKINNVWYYFQSGGAMATGWQQINNIWYYFKDSGAMAAGWQKISNKWYYFKDSGAMVTGWLKLNNNWYYFQSSGVMAANTDLTIGGKTYHFNASGVCTNP